MSSLAKAPVYLRKPRSHLGGLVCVPRSRFTCTQAAHGRLWWRRPRATPRGRRCNAQPPGGSGSTPTQPRASWPGMMGSQLAPPQGPRAQGPPPAADPLRRAPRLTGQSPGRGQGQGQVTAARRRWRPRPHGALRWRRWSSRCSMLRPRCRGRAGWRPRRRWPRYAENDRDIAAIRLVAC